MTTDFSKKGSGFASPFFGQPSDEEPAIAGCSALSKVMDWDRIQLCAQALCLEHMRGASISQGALWYWQERKRESVVFDQPLRQITEEVIAQAHQVLASGITPRPTSDVRRCKACSLHELCLPQLMRHDHSEHYVSQMFDPRLGELS